MTVLTKPHILHLTGCLAGGGAETILRSLCRDQRAQGYLVTVIYFYETRGSKAARADLRQIGCCVYQINPLMLLIRSDLRQQLMQADILHTHLLNLEIYGLILSGLFKKKWIASRYLPLITRRRRQLINRLTLHKADAVICISRTIKNFLTDQMPAADKCHVVYPGLHPQEMIRRQQGMDVRAVYRLGTNPFALIPARLVEQKGLLSFLEAIASVETDLKNWYFIFAGSGPLRESLQARAQRAGLNDRIIFANYRENIFDFMQQADLIILPSLWEGFGMALLEAMHFGKPIITTDIPAVREWIGSAALLVPAGNTARMAEALKKMINPDRRLELALRSRQRAANFPSWRTAQQVTGIYEHILGQGPTLSEDAVCSKNLNIGSKPQIPSGHCLF